MSSQLSAFGHGVVVAAGPWLVTTFGLAAMTLLGGASVAQPAIADLRLVIIYAFAFGFIGTAPATIIGTRRLADSLYVGRFDDAPAIFIRTLAIGAAATAGLLATVALLLGQFTQLLVPGIVCGILVGTTWVAAAFCGATRDYRAILVAVALGITTSVILTLLSATSGGDSVQLVWAYCTGCAITTGLLIARVLATFPYPITRIDRSVATDVGLLGIGALLNALALWGDRFVVWMSPLAERTLAGFVHAPLYDGAMLIANLSLVPGLALFVIHLETSASSGLRRVHATILDHAPLHQIEAEAVNMRRSVIAALHRIVLMQAAICLMLVTFAQDFLPLAGFDSRQIAVARLGAIAALFQFVFYACTAIILYADKRREYVWLQVSMLVMTVALTALSIAVDVRFLGAGVLVASVVSGLLAYFAMVRMLEQLAYNTFVASMFKTRRSANGPEWSWRAQMPERSASGS